MQKSKKSKKLAAKLQSKTKSEKISGAKKTKILVVGIGGGGGNIVSELAQRVKKATFLAANTDSQALKGVSRKVKPFLFGQSFTQGLGTGMNPELAETASQNEKERIKKILQNQDLVIFIACLGGGTGSGATPIFAKISQSLGNLSYGIFTLPFKFEGEKKMEIAKKALEILRPKLNAITVLPNERIFQVIDKTTPLKEAFLTINKSLAQSLEGLIETIYQPGLINIDFADLRTILTGSRGRLAYLNTLSLTRKEGVAREIAEKALTSPLYPYSIRGAKGVLFNIVGERELSLQEVSQISKTISEKVNPEAKIIFGIQPLFFKKGPGYQNIIKTTIFATGISAKIFDRESKKLKERKIKLTKVRDQETEKLSTFSQELLSEPKTKKEKKTEPKKIKIKTAGKLGEKRKTSSEIKVKETKKEDLSISNEKTRDTKENLEYPPTQVKVRKNGLQIKKEIEEEEREILEKEKFWETPAFLRKKLKTNQRGDFVSNG